MSPVVVKSIKTSQRKIDLKQLEFKYDKNEEKIISSLIPPPEVKITFEIHNTSPSFANALRRTIIDELPLYSLTCELDKIRSSDRKLITATDSITRRLELIPLSQDPAKKAIDSGLQFSIIKVNNTSNSIPVTSADIIVRQPDSKKIIKKNEAIIPTISNLKYFSDKIIICELDKGKYLHIDNITIFSKKNRELSIGGQIHSFVYVPIEHEKQLNPISGLNPMEPSSLTVQPSKYRLGFTMNYVSTPPMYIIKLACQELISRLNVIKNEIGESDGDIPYYSDVLEITKPEKIIHYKIMNESYTIGRMLFKYGFDIDPSIPFITNANEHALIYTTIIKIIHPDSQKLLTKAIDNIIADLNIVFKSFDK